MITVIYYVILALYLAVALYVVGLMTYLAFRQHRSAVTKPLVTGRVKLPRAA